MELEYASELYEMLNPSYQMSTLMCTLFISFFQDHRADIIDVFTHQITGLLNFEDVELSDSTIFYTQKPYLYIPLCHSGHWILLKFETNTGLLKIFNSVSQYASTVAVNVIVNCLRSSYNRIVQIQRLPCPQQQNGTDCGFYVFLFLLLDLFEYNVSEFLVTDSTTLELRTFVQNVLITSEYSGIHQFFSDHRRQSPLTTQTISQTLETLPKNEKDVSQKSTAAELETLKLELERLNAHLKVVRSKPGKKSCFKEFAAGTTLLVHIINLLKSEISIREELKKRKTANESERRSRTRNNQIAFLESDANDLHSQRMVNIFFSGFKFL